MYAVFSDVAASPFDAEPAVAGEPVAVSELGLPYELPGLEALLTEWRVADRDALKARIQRPVRGGQRRPAGADP